MELFPDIILVVIKIESIINDLGDFAENPHEHELLEAQEVELSVLFFGKTYTKKHTENGWKYFLSDFNNDSPIYNFGSKAVMSSPWAQEHAVGNPPRPVAIEANNFNKQGYTINTARPWSNNGFAVVSIEWRTDRDWELEMNGKIQGELRKFPVVEVRRINSEKALELIKRGYGLWTTIANQPNLIRTQDGIVNRGQRNIQELQVGKNAKDVVSLSGNEDTLWTHEDFADDERLLALMADIYTALLTKKLVYVDKTSHLDTQKTILLAQAISQLIAIKQNRLIGWATEYGIATGEFQPYNLIFVNLKETLNFYPQENIVIHQEKSVITEQNKATVETFRKIFKLHHASKNK